MRRQDGRAVPTFIQQAIAGKPLTVHGDGTQTRSLCYVDPELRCPDISLARQLLDWEPVVSLEDGLARSIEWARAAWT